MIYKVRHLTVVEYTDPVRLARFNLRLKPAHWPGQILYDYRLNVLPNAATVHEDYGPFIVNRSRLKIRDSLKRITIESKFRAEVHAPLADMDQMAVPSVGQVRDQALTRNDLSALSPASYLYPSPIAASSAEIAAWVLPIFDPAESVVKFGRTLMERLYREFNYDDEATGADTPPIEAFRHRRGVCQDFAHIMIITARALGIPAAYVSGYLRTIPPPGKERLVGADAMHAWVSLWCGDALGWVGFDPTNNLVVGTDHIFIAMGRDYSDVAPIDGVFHGGAGQKMKVAVDVEPVT